jgi:hypothetical protein
MSFPPGTEMFQFPGFASHAYGFSTGSLIRGGLPHSDIRGSTIARISPRLFAACHVLHRLLVPRHPPNALLTLNTHTHPNPNTRFRNGPPAHRGHTRTRRQIQPGKARPDTHHHPDPSGSGPHQGDRRARATVTRHFSNSASHTPLNVRRTPPPHKKAVPPQVRAPRPGTAAGETLPHARTRPEPPGQTLSTRRHIQRRTRTDSP